jgi:hypothetical protein
LCWTLFSLFSLPARSARYPCALPPPGSIGRVDSEKFVDDSAIKAHHYCQLLGIEISQGRGAEASVTELAAEPPSAARPSCNLTSSRAPPPMLAAFAPFLCTGERGVCTDGRLPSGGTSFSQSEHSLNPFQSRQCKSVAPRYYSRVRIRSHFHCWPSFRVPEPVIIICLPSKRT